ncbi:MAG: UDP-N-acetylmuramoyl-L-alanyl-D-glutamate--2,6-diaminopimelate ligase [Acidobacteria bacterium]|nr:UDP-N-acetylmuramoyl-L-alanyl-D-glutamate--2,6-diaminopimelate ligase [Acidobacteriota bacterium]MCI0720128.1 UDP-N-acetylmuramoyl-L-alanyl-D-glutamate--2,6-diaminopimelate ligase [Acidobacteriota bacterium]
MQLSQLLQDVAPISDASFRNVEIHGLAYDSRKVGSGYLFVAIKGEKTDGNFFTAQAMERGAAAILSENSAPAGFSGCWIQVGNARQALAKAAASFYQNPTRAFELIGITGTNGKTSTAYLIESILRAAGARVGVISTIEYRGPEGKRAAERTTPESLDLQALFAKFVEQRCRFIVMEVSSHALDMERAHFCQFRTAVFTNLTQDHLDYHHTLENYFLAKQRLFLGTGLKPPAQSVINRDDPYGASLELICAGRCLTYSTAMSADFQILDSRLEKAGLWVRLRTPEAILEIQTRLMGRPNLSNTLAAVAVAWDLGIEPAAIQRGIESCAPIPGRFEWIDCGQPFHVFVDYAHTPDALEKLLLTTRELRPKRLLVLFGCGGERDRAKRPAMARIAESLADFCWITSDNPRNEDPMQILAEIESGFQARPVRYQLEPDRRTAIREALRQAQPGDAVVIAGKGHETYQVRADRTVHFDDREEVRQALGELGFSS